MEQNARLEFDMLGAVYKNDQRQRDFPMGIHGPALLGPIVGPLGQSSWWTGRVRACCLLFCPSSFYRLLSIGLERAKGNGSAPPPFWP